MKKARDFLVVTIIGILIFRILNIFMHQQLKTWWIAWLIGMIFAVAVFLIQELIAWRKRRTTMSSAVQEVYQYFLNESDRWEQAALPHTPHYGSDNLGSLHCLEIARQIKAGQYGEALAYLAKKNERTLITKLLGH